MVAASILVMWFLLYRVFDPGSHWGSFFGNAIADWTGVLVMVLATKHLYESGSEESKNPPSGFFPSIIRVVRKHSLTIFILVTGVGWILLFSRSDPMGKWGQVVSNIISEWSQLLGLVLLTKKLRESHSKESKS
jgi:membrane protease YdiL (CAAX protease family)